MECSYTADGSVNWYKHFEKLVGNIYYCWNTFTLWPNNSSEMSTCKMTRRLLEHYQNTPRSFDSLYSQTENNSVCINSNRYAHWGIFISTMEYYTVMKKNCHMKSKMDESHWHNSQWKKSDKKDYILCESIYTVIYAYLWGLDIDYVGAGVSSEALEMFCVLIRVCLNEWIHM